LKKTFDELYHMGVTHYVLQGGEPLMDMERLGAIINMIYPDETYVNVVTNGWHINKDTVKKLKALKVDKICFSLDSGFEDEHDANRMPGSYKRVLQGIDDVLDEGLLTSVSIAVTHSTLYSESYNKILRYANSKQIRVDTQLAQPIGGWAGHFDQIVTDEDSEYLSRLCYNAPPLTNGLMAIKRDIFTDTPGVERCPAGTEILDITVDGNLLPCVYVQCTLGNIRDRSIKEMRDDLLKSPWFDGKHKKCLTGQNLEFIKKYNIPYLDTVKPMDAYKIFGLRRC